MNPGWSSLLWFAAVVVAIPFVLLLLKRTPLGGGAAHGAMRMVGMLSVAPNQRVVTIEVGHGSERRWLVLGVTAQQITMLHALPPQADAAMPLAAAQPPFAQVLGRLWSKPEGGGDAR